MAIRNLVIGNFKGIRTDHSFEIAPITIFIGANSSGKSSCIHALAALTQTTRLGDVNRPIVLDDENAYVHLGRFIEVIHTKSYKDSMHIGVDLGPLPADMKMNTEGKLHIFAPKGSPVSAEYWFKSTLKTQEVQLTKALLKVGPEELILTAKDQVEYKIERNGKSVPFLAKRSALAFQVVPVAKLTTDFLAAYVLLEQVQRMQTAELRRCSYLGPFRDPPRRRYQNFGSFPTQVGSFGENSVTLLANEYLKTKTRPHLQRIGKWLAEMGLAKAVNLKRVGTSDLFEVALTLPDEKQLPIADLGYGLSQVLPVLVQCSFAAEAATLLFEQPELHLHHGAARRLAKVFAETYERKKCHIILETHSTELVRELMKYVRDGSLKTSDLALYEVKREGGESHFRRVGIELEGGVVEVDHPWFVTLD